MEVDIKIRSPEDILKKVRDAKLEESELIPVTQVLRFGDQDVLHNNYKLMELDKDLINAIKVGQTLTFKGNADENVVLCTNDRTYEVIEAETSNSLSVLKYLDFYDDLKAVKDRSVREKVVVGIYYTYLEPRITKPHLLKITQLLEYGKYKGPEYEDMVEQNELLTFEELVNNAQASENEIKNILESLPVVIINSRCRMLDFEYHFRILSLMLKLIEENSWSLDEIDYEETISCLSSLAPVEVLDKLFKLYTIESQKTDEKQFYKYDECKVCRFFAQVLLLHAGKFNLQEFLQAWKESVPEGMIADEEMLNGIAVINRQSIPNCIWAFPEFELPLNVNERFKALFQTKERWTANEIKPYIQPLASERMDVNALLSKYARAFNVHGVRYYSTKHT